MKLSLNSIYIGRKFRRYKAQTCIIFTMNEILKDQYRILNIGTSYYICIYFYLWSDTYKSKLYTKKRKLYRIAKHSAQQMAFGSVNIFPHSMVQFTNFITFKQRLTLTYIDERN